MWTKPDAFLCQIHGTETHLLTGTLDTRRSEEVDVEMVRHCDNASTGWRIGRAEPFRAQGAQDCCKLGSDIAAEQFVEGRCQGTISNDNQFHSFLRCSGLEGTDLQQVLQQAPYVCGVGVSGGDLANGAPSVA
jgi:hypothetical protein